MCLHLRRALYIRSTSNFALALLIPLQKLKAKTTVDNRYSFWKYDESYKSTPTELVVRVNRNQLQNDATRVHVNRECNYVGVQALWFDFVSPVAIMVEGSKTSEYSMRVWNYYAPVNWLNATCQTIPNDQIWSKARSKLVVDLCSSVWFFFWKTKSCLKTFYHTAVIEINQIQ